ncbi:hypothetical protein Acr_29g0000050 [Actinidia rufa]|uniref:Uncharacterized protein n=1 Tax=Actinidia rufa TaxID=165716 RepID=A0A7J0HCK7_9ERIC|nr:hypothetical protein Acr_29g0000050 [Actinidia rufa]
MMMNGYHLSPRSMDGSTVYSLTQQLVRLSTHQAAVCPVMGQLTRQATRHTVSYKINFSFRKRHLQGHYSWHHKAITVSASVKPKGSPLMCPRTLGDRGAKVLADAQRTAKVTSKQRPSRLLFEGEDNRDVTIKCLQTQLAEMTQILVYNILMKLPQMDKGEPSKGKSGGARE